ncbi:MAG: DNA mismatch repair endonuclease MutL, partial [Dehalococcoidia bacterium]
MTIKVLPPELAAQIAAGEVVERPVSVVKELVENAIDAGATQITVEIQGGGVDQIRVIDNGGGIPQDEVDLAFQHHATSKLTLPEQLGAIGTLGFRGEAVPSIAAVSQMSVSTRPAAASAGHRVEYQWGHKVREGAQGGPPGTAVVVSDLFGNLPARRKFLKSASAEASRVHDLIARYALAYPELRFQLTAGSRQVLNSPGSGRPEEALLAVYGPEVASGMLEVHGQDPETGYRVDGYVSAPSLNRANRTYLTFFVNRRWIQNRMLSFALEEAYHGLLPEKRYPLAVVNLTLPYAEVDVNSHPAKREVRFHQEGKVYSTLQRAVRSALIAESPVPDLQHSPGLAASGGPTSPSTPGFLWSAFDRRSGSGPSSTNVYAGDSPGPADAALTPRQALPALRVVGQVRLT